MSGYTDQEIAAIGQWLREGLSATGIAGRLSVARGRAVSRNAIIGIVLRNKVLNGIGFARGSRARKAGIRVPAPKVRRADLARASQSRAKASEDNGRISATSCAPVTGEASRPDAGRSASATSEIMDATAGETALHSPERATTQRANVLPQHEAGSVDHEPDGQATVRNVGVTAGETAPISFLDAVDGRLCLFFACEVFAPDGPDMPVCGRERQTHTRKPYCEFHLRAEVAA